MHVGTSIFFQNHRQTRTDHEVYQNELRLADLAEPLGFESIWGVEHHFTDYTMCPDVLQFLSYLAGRTEKVLLGSMVVVLPWHNPVNVAEKFSVLDHLSGGRAVVGVGRGLARVEYDGFQLDMSESRTRFAESARLLVRAFGRRSGRVRRGVDQAAQGGHPAQAVQEFPGADLCRRRVTGILAGAGRVGVGHVDYSTETLERG